MLKIKPTPLTLLLAAMLAIGASAITTTTATAAPFPIFSFCAKVPAGRTYGEYSNPDSCQNAQAGGEYVLVFPDLENTYWACTEVAHTLEFSSGLCNEPGTKFGLLLVTITSKPTLHGSNIGISTLKGSLAGAPATISCKSGSFSDVVEASGKQEQGEFEYTGCKSVAPANCTVKEPIKGIFTGQLEEGSGKLVNKLTGANRTVKGVFTEIEYSGCATLAGNKFPVSGSQACEGEGELAVLGLLQTVICASSGSNLKFGTLAATFSGKGSATLSTGWSWGVLTGKAL